MKRRDLIPAGDGLITDAIPTPKAPRTSWWATKACQQSYAAFHEAMTERTATRNATKAPSDADGERE